MAGRLEGLLALIRSGLTSEKLPDPPPASPDASPGHPSRFRALVARESLPAPIPAPPQARHPSLLALLFAREPLPLEPERTRTHRNWLTYLLAPERLDPPGDAGPEVH